GTARWTAGAGGNHISGGWNIYSTVFSGGDGVIYGITPQGDLQWYRHDGWTDGTARWTAGAGGNHISGGWNIYDTVFSDAARAGADAGVGPAPVRVPQKSVGMISYRRVVCDGAGVLRAYEGQVEVGDEPLPVGPLDFIGESFSYKYTFLDASGSVRVTAGEVTATAQGRVQVGVVRLGGSIDGKRLTAQGSAEFVTAKIEGSASVDAGGVAAANAEGRVVGPAARGSVGIGLDGGGAEVGVSAGEIGGHVGVTIGGKSYGVGGEIGLKAELGLQWGPTSTIKLPIITISGPNPLAGVTSFAAGAVNDLVRDPFRTAEKTVSDIVGVGEDAVEAIGQAFEDVGDTLTDLFGSDEDDHIVTSDQTQGPRPRNPQPGSVIID
ncbi:tachylectin-related carbohydrate-binding protein, partial [Actinocorallia aurea]